MFKKLKKHYQKFKEDMSVQLIQSKTILRDRWNIGAEAGKNLKKKQKETLKKLRDKDDKQ